METPLSGNPKTGRKPLLIPYRITMQRRMMNCPTGQGQAVLRGCPKASVPFGPNLFCLLLGKGEEER